MQENQWGWAVIGPLYGWFSVALLAACFAILFVILGVSLRKGEFKADSAQDQQKLPIQVFPTLDAANTLLLSVTNNGPTDFFVGQIRTTFGAKDFLVSPFTIRWQYSTSAKCEIVSGQAEHLQVVQFSLQANPDDGLDKIEFFSPGGSDKLTPRHWHGSKEVKVYDTLNLGIQIASATTGKNLYMELKMDVFIIKQTLHIRAYDKIH
jgi:hypothetical protein